MTRPKLCVIGCGLPTFLKGRFCAECWATLMEALRKPKTMPENDIEIAAEWAATRARRYAKKKAAK